MEVVVEIAEVIVVMVSGNCSCSGGRGVHRAGQLGSVHNIRNPIGLVNVKMVIEPKRTTNISVRKPEIIRLVRVGKRVGPG